MPSWDKLRRFLKADGWELYKSTDHDFYRKVEPDLTIKRTKVSRGTGEIRKHLWQEIWKRQLQVTQEYFNSKI